MQKIKVFGRDKAEKEAVVSLEERGSLQQLRNADGGWESRAGDNKV